MEFVGQRARKDVIVDRVEWVLRQFLHLQEFLFKLAHLFALFRGELMVTALNQHLVLKLIKLEVGLL